MKKSLLTIFLPSSIYICDLEKGWMPIHQSQIKRGMIIKFNGNEKEYIAESGSYKTNNIYTINVREEKF